MEAIFRTRLVNHYKCQRCWGPLVERYREGVGWEVECAKAGPDHGGHFVTDSFVHYRRSQESLEACEVRANYAEMLGLKRHNTAAARSALYGDDTLL